MTDKITESVASEIHRMLYNEPMFVRANVPPEQASARIDMAINVARAAIAAYKQAVASEAVAWESTTDIYVKYVTDERYQRFSDGIKAWYKPYKCSSCASPPAIPAGWKPIETAPKDGTPAILFSPYDEDINCKGGLIWVSGGYGRAVIYPNSWRGESNKNPPTLWMPLPAAPTPGGRE